MSNIDIIRAWKDSEYRNSLTQEQLDSIPENPAGIVELSSADLSKVTGGQSVFQNRPNDLFYTQAGKLYSYCCVSNTTVSCKP